MMSDLDLLMDLDPLSLSDADIDAIVAYHRNIRAKGRWRKAHQAQGRCLCHRLVDPNKIKPAETKPVRRI